MKTTTRAIFAFLMLAGMLVFSATADDEKTANLFHKVGEKAAREGNYGKAVEQLEMALRCCPSHPGAVVTLGKVFARRLEPHMMTALYERWLRVFESLRNPSKDQERVEKEMQSDMKSLARLEEIEKEYSKRFVAVGRRLKGSDKAAAIDCYKTAMFLDPRNMAVARTYERLTSGSEKVKKEEKIGELNGIRLGRRLAADDFTRKSSSWSQSKKAYHKDDRYMVKSGMRPVIVTYKHNCEPKNLYAEARIQYMGEGETSDEVAAGICFRVQNSRNYYTFLVSTNGNFGLWLVLDGNKVDLTGKEKPYPPTTFGCCEPDSKIGRFTSRNTVSVAMVGEAIYCYVDRKLVFKCRNDKILSGGRTGFCVNTGNNLFAFDDFKVFDAILPE